MFGFMNRRLIATLLALSIATTSLLIAFHAQAAPATAEDWKRCYDLSVAQPTYTVLDDKGHSDCAELTDPANQPICTSKVSDTHDPDIYGFNIPNVLTCRPPEAPPGGTPGGTPGGPIMTEEELDAAEEERINRMGAQGDCNDAGGLWLERPDGWSRCVPKPDYVPAEHTEPCRVDGIGQFFCPIINTMADFMDTAFAFLSDNFLVMKPQLVQGDETKQAWERFRDIANVMFVLGFLVIVYSQITNAGLSNYGIKKMLPKLIVVAILVNTSYFICQLAVDISNYLGYALAQFFGQALLPRVEGSDVTNSLSGGAGTVAIIVAAVLAAGLVLYLTLSMGVLIPAVLSLILVMIILIARQALIILLLVIAPLAFVAYLLPNTEHLLKSWWKMFYALLIVFPIIGLIFGASKMVSGIIMEGVALPANPGDPLPPGFNFAMAFMAIGAAALPFLAVPTVLKGSLKATGALGAKLEGATNKIAGMAGKNAKKNMKDKYDRSYMGKFMEAREKERNIRNARIAGGTYDYQGKSPIGKLNRFRSRMASKINTSGVSGTAGDTMAAMGSAMETKEREASIKAANESFDLANPDDKELLALQRGETVTTKSGTKLSGKNAAVRMAAGARVIGNGDTGSINKLINQATSLKATDREGAVELNHMADALEKSKSKPKYIQAKDIAAMRHNGAGAAMNDAAGMMTQGLKDNVYGPEAMVTTGRNETSVVRRHIAELQKSSGYGTDEKAAVDTYIDNARALTGDKRATFQVTDALKSKLSKQSEDVLATADGKF